MSRGAAAGEGVPQVPRQGPHVIESRHGTTLMEYVFHAARKRAQDDDLNEADFRYPGPKPSTKETAVLLLCDCVESASRKGAGSWSEPYNSGAEAASDKPAEAEPPAEADLLPDIDEPAIEDQQPAVESPVQVEESPAADRAQPAGEEPHPDEMQPGSE